MNPSIEATSPLGPPNGAFTIDVNPEGGPGSAKVVES